MKVIKSLALTFVLSIAAACIGVQADNTLSLIGVDISAGLNQTYTTQKVKKTVDNEQYIKTIGTTNNRSVKGLLKNTNGDQSTNKTLSKGKCVSLVGSDGVGFYKGTYYLVITATGFNVTTTEYTGTWLLDGGLYSSIC